VGAGIRPRPLIERFVCTRHAVSPCRKILTADRDIVWLYCRFAHMEQSGPVNFLHTANGE